jgi:hypothetical protein
VFVVTIYEVVVDFVRHKDEVVLDAEIANFFEFVF